MFNLSDLMRFNFQWHHRQFAKWGDSANCDAMSVQFSRWDKEIPWISLSQRLSAH